MKYAKRIWLGLLILTVLSVTFFGSRKTEALARNTVAMGVQQLARLREAVDLRRAGSTTAAEHMPAVVLFGLLVLATLVSEDLTCIWAGVLAAEGRTSFALAATGCLAGIFLGDMLLFLAGRLIGRSVLRRAPLKWFVRESAVERSSAWFERRGMAAIALSRFLPGTRLPTYFAAGLLKTNALKFAGYFFLAAAIWTPLLVGASMLLGRQVVESALLTDHLLLRLAISAVLMLVAVRLVIRLSTWRGRRLLLGRWRRLTRWEFWPAWVFYPPVVVYIVFLGFKHRCLTLFTAANPAIEEGGFVGESKSKILRGLGQRPASRAFIAPFRLLNRSLSHHERRHHAREFMLEHDGEFPVVLKPDAGERGAGVAIVRTEDELNNYLTASPNSDVIIQKYAPGLEFGVFYVRYPDRKRGEIYSITKKLFPTIIGDGQNTREVLILEDERAVCLAQAYFDAQRDQLLDVPAIGESIPLVEVGTHCRGSVFLDGTELRTDALEQAIDQIAGEFKGFYFGRFDIRTPSLIDFQQGCNFKIVELNGVTSEATNIYDPKNSVFAAYRVLFEQWRIAFAIGAQNRERGIEPATLRSLIRRIVEKYRSNDERNRPDLRPMDVAAESTAP